MCVYIYIYILYMYIYIYIYIYSLRVGHAEQRALRHGAVRVERGEQLVGRL